MLDLEDKLSRIAALKAGEETPIRCGKCDYCKSTKKLDSIINYVNL
jgi:glutaredoxin